MLTTGSRAVRCTCRLLKVEPSLTSRKQNSPPPASRPVFTHPPTRSLWPTCVTVVVADDDAHVEVHRQETK